MACYVAKIYQQPQSAALAAPVPVEMTIAAQPAAAPAESTTEAGEMDEKL